jgi:hypothetical protein
MTLVSCIVILYTVEHIKIIFEKIIYNYMYIHRVVTYKEILFSIIVQFCVQRNVCV